MRRGLNATSSEYSDFEVLEVIKQSANPCLH